MSTVSQQRSNEYLRKYTDLLKRYPEEFDYRRSHHRWDLVKQYSFSVPSEEALEALSQYSPIVEIGAGTGYWAALLKEHGARVQAFEPHPIYGNPYKFKRAYTSVAKGDHRRALRMYPNYTLLFSWPDYGATWSAEALKLHKGRYVAYIGEGLGGCTGSDEMFAILNLAFSVVEEVHLPQWDGIHDNLTVYERDFSKDLRTLVTKWKCPNCGYAENIAGDFFCYDCCKYLNEEEENGSTDN